MTGCSHDNIKIRVLHHGDYNVYIDTIHSMQRFTGYYPTDERCLIPGGKASFKPDTGPIRILEIHWESIRNENSGEVLTYRTDIQNSVFVFPDEPARISIDPQNGTVSGTNLSERNHLFFAFQDKLKEIYSERLRHEKWEDSIKTLPADRDLKRYAYRTHQRRMDSIRVLQEQLASQVRGYQNPDVKLIASLMIDGLLSDNSQIKFPGLVVPSLRLEERLVEQINKYLLFRKNPLGSEVPNFYEHTVDGKTVELHDFKGDFVIIDFWASYCGPCIRRAEEVLKPLYDKYSGKGIKIVGISLDRDLKRWQECVEREGYPWININTSEVYSVIPSVFDVKDIPEMVVIDEQLRLVGREIQQEMIRHLLDDQEKP